MNKIKIYITFLYILLSFSLTAFPVKAATASFSTSGGGNTSTNKTFNVSVSVNGSEAYNAITVSVNFSNLTYVSSSAGAGWTPVSGPSVSGNTVTFSGAVLGSSYTGSRNALNLTFKTLGNPGAATIKSSGTIALANGSGTQVNGGGNTVTYTVATPAPLPTATPLPKPVPNAPKVISSTHSDSSAWYKAKDVSLSWIKDAGVSGFSYEFNNSADTIPDENPESDTTTANYPDTKEGTYYFHIRAKNDIGWSTTTHFKVNIDLSPPQPFCITSIQEGSDGEKTLYFASNDTLSGIQKYLVKTDSIDVGEQKSGFKVNKDIKSVTITALDNAGNTRESVLKLEQGKEAVSCTAQPTQTPGTTTQTPTSTVIEKTDKGLIRILLITNVLGILISGGGVYYLLKHYFPGRNLVVEETK